MIQPFKEFTEEELSSARFLHLRICTSGLDNPKLMDEAFDYKNACPECKAGRIPKGELKISTTNSKMGKKKIDSNFRYGFLIFENDLVDKVKEGKLSGIQFKSASLGKDTDSFKEGRILNTFPKLASNTNVHTEAICNTCGRSGHYDSQIAPTELWTQRKDIDKLTDDFYFTWEYFGIWAYGQTYPLPVVSQKFRRIITDNYKLRHLRFEPILEQK